MATDTDTAAGFSKTPMTSTDAARHWHFSFSVIDNPVRLNESFALRFEVYCNERQFLPAEDYPSKLEIDPYDRYSIHIGGTNQDGTMIGTVRLVKPSSIGFPLFEHCVLFPEYQHLCDEKVQHTAGEISRLAISRMFRRRLNDGLYGLAYKNEGADPEPGQPLQPPAESRHDRRNKPEIILGLYKAMYQTSKRQGITHWFVAMEKTLQRLLSRFSFEFKPVGPELDYYGPVTPYIAVISEIEETVYKNNPDLFMDFMSGLEPEFLPEFARKLLC